MNSLFRIMSLYTQKQKYQLLLDPGLYAAVSLKEFKFKKQKALRRTAKGLFITNIRFFYIYKYLMIVIPVIPVFSFFIPVVPVPCVIVLPGPEILVYCYEIFPV
jgi:hypothetical protein